MKSVVKKNQKILGKIWDNWESGYFGGGLPPPGGDFFSAHCPPQNPIGGVVDSTPCPSHPPGHPRGASLAVSVGT